MELFVEDEHSHFRGRTDFNSLSQQTVNDTVQPPVPFSLSERRRFNGDVVRLGMRGEHHRPLGLRRQLDSSAEVFAPTRKEDVSLASSASVALGWIVSDRWTGSASLRGSWNDKDRTYRLAGRFDSRDFFRSMGP